MSDPVTVVQDFFGLLAAGDSAAAVALLDDDVEWRNSKMPTLRGKAVGQTLDGLERRGIGFRVDMHHIAADGDVVLTDRTDYLRFGKVESGFWVAGTFVVREGRIVLWDDRYSVADVILGSLKGLAGLFR